jgi:hypothetical protein
MQKLERRILLPAVFLAAAALLAGAGGLAAHSAGEQETPPQEQARTSAAQDPSQAPEQSPAESRPTAPVRPAVPHVTGTVIRWTGNRIDLRTPEGKTQKVAVNEDTERLVEIEEGAEVTVEYRREISGFVIAERVLSPDAGAAAAQSGEGAAPGQGPSTVTGSVISWSAAALVLRTDVGDVTLFLSPRTEYLVESLAPGLLVSVEFQEGADSARVATRVRTAKEEDSAKEESGPESAREHGDAGMRSSDRDVPPQGT